jgi:hypothetical protein
MTSDSAAKKLRLKKYVKRFGGPEQQADQQTDQQTLSF